MCASNRGAMRDETAMTSRARSQGVAPVRSQTVVADTCTWRAGGGGNPPGPHRAPMTRALAAGKERRPHARHTPLAIGASCCASGACCHQKARRLWRGRASVAFQASGYRVANHRALSRLPSRPQPFQARRCRPRARDASTDGREHGNPPVRCGVREPLQGGVILEVREVHHPARSTACRAPDSVALRT
jgi:hypothetical protein